MMKIDFNAIAIFVKVVEYKSFSEASRQQHIPISTISRKVSELERKLKVRLLDRTTRKLRLTELGFEYYTQCLRGVEEFENANYELMNKRAEVSGTLRLSIPPNISDILIVPIVRKYQEAYPKVKVKILVTERKVNLIEDGVDLAFRVGSPEDSSIIVKRLLKYRHLLVASPKYLDQAGYPSDPSDLPEYKVIAFTDWYSDIIWEMYRDSQVKRVKLEPCLALNDYSGVQKAVIDGQGISEIPSIICGKLINEGKLIEVLSNWQFKPVSMYAVYSSNRNISRVISLFKDLCVEHFKQQIPYIKV